MDDAPAAPLVSVIIPAFNDPERLSRCLDALAQQTWPASQLEIIVADNGSNPPIAPMLEKWANVQTVMEPEPGSYVARNSAIRLAKGEFYTFTDSDCIPEPDWIEKGIGALQKHTDASFIGGRVRVFAEDPVRPRLVERYEMVFAFDQVRYIGLGFSVTANLMVRAEVVKKIGAFNAKLQSNGDREWGERATNLGHVGLYCEDAVVAHPARKTLRDLQKKATRVVGGRHARGKQRRLSNELICSVLPRPSRIARAFRRARGFSLRERIEVALIRMLVEYFRAWEGMRLRLGGKPRR